MFTLIFLFHRYDEAKNIIFNRINMNIVVKKNEKSKDR
jgi:hypothetical protein